MDYFWFKQTSQVVYQGGDILTMNGSKPEYVDCIVTEGAEIVYVGKNLPSVYQFIVIAVPINFAIFGFCTHC